MEKWWEERSLIQKIFAVIGFVILGIGFMALFGLAVMLLWNWLMPELFGLNEVTYRQGFGLLALCTILFKNIPSSGESSKTDRKRKKKLRTYMHEESQTEPGTSE